MLTLQDTVKIINIVQKSSNWIPFYDVTPACSAESDTLPTRLPYQTCFMNANRRYIEARLGAGVYTVQHPPRRITTPNLSLSLRYQSSYITTPRLLKQLRRRKHVIYRQLRRQFYNNIYYVPHGNTNTPFWPRYIRYSFDLSFVHYDEISSERIENT